MSQPVLDVQNDFSGILSSNRTQHPFRALNISAGPPYLFQSKNQQLKRWTNLRRRKPTRLATLMLTVFLWHILL